MGISKLIDFIIAQINNLIPFKIIFQFHKGAKYWCGKFVCTLEPGMHFKIPYLHSIYSESAVDTTIMLPAQSVMTWDDKTIVVRASVGYKILDAGLYFNNVYDAKSAISDNACLILRQVCESKPFDDVRDIETGKLLRRILQDEVTDYGISINFMGIVDICETSSFRLFNENVKLES